MYKQPLFMEIKFYHSLTISTIKSTNEPWEKNSHFSK